MFDDTNGYGAIPDALPASYGYADRQASTVHANMPTALSSNPFDQVGANQMVVASNPTQPSLQPSYGGMQPGPVQGRNVHNPAPQPGPRPDLGAATGKRIKSSIPIQTDEARSLEFREYDGHGGYRYRQYENGKYAIVRVGKGKGAGLPPNVKLGVPFDGATNKKAFEGIKDEVETAIGPFPGTVSEASVEIKAGTKAPPKGGGKKEAKSEPQAQASSGGGGGFQSSGADTKETLPPEEEGGKDKDGNWLTQSTLGVPHWGWIAGVVVVGAGAGYYLYSSSKSKAPPAEVK